MKIGGKRILEATAEDEGKRRLRLRLAGSYALFQVLNLFNLLLAVLVSVCVLAFVLAIRGQTVNHLLPWFLLLAAPIWVLASYLTYSALIRHGILRPTLSRKQSGPPANDESANSGKDHEAQGDTSAQGEQPTDDNSLQRISSL